MTRIAVIEKEKCNPASCGNMLCARLCPINRTGSECIVKGSDGKPVISEELCTGCGICQNRCPFDAISIINLPEDLTKEPIHQYGQNGFHLYNLPVPIFGKVVGIIGKNGIGKSTAMQILAGILRPNLGKINQEADDKEIIKYFKGTEAQIFFEKLSKGKIKVAYKPQHVSEIPKQANGTVRQLLKKVDEKGKFDEIVEQLDLKHVLDNDISEISGGELQRVAIAATVLKEANVYFFDEPTSYLDIKQRINVSKFIRTLADKDTAVIVIEHDLIILDYLTDLVHLMYGKPGVYGIVSMPKSTKLGINVYLHGFLKEENIRFRDKQIRFDSRPTVKKSQNQELVGWEELEKKLGHFTLRAEKGAISQRRTTGILGENGTGKTSFVRMLTEEIKPDKGKITGKVKVSYKPQYLESNSKELVINVLKQAIQKYDIHLIRPLELKALFMKRLDQLSGGELQRVSIALCLSKDADLFLLDEPSAYLDVEQRLVVSKILRDLMEHKGTTALVVDHDLLFADYISDDLMVFDGEPAESGNAKGPFAMEEGMNLFLDDLNITLRRDKETKRPRINKEDSQMDNKQKKEGKRYYT